MRIDPRGWRVANYRRALLSRSGWVGPSGEVPSRYTSGHRSNRSDCKKYQKFTKRLLMEALWCILAGVWVRKGVTLVMIGHISLKSSKEIPGQQRPRAESATSRHRTRGK